MWFISDAPAAVEFPLFYGIAFYLIFWYSGGKLLQILVSRLDSISRQHKHVPIMRPVPDRNMNRMAKYIMTCWLFVCAMQFYAY